MKRILFIVDVEGWAYDDAAKNWKKLLEDNYDIDILYLDSYKPLKTTHSLYRLFREYQTYEINNQKVSPSGFLDLDRKRMFLDENDEITEPIFDHTKYDGIFFFYHRAVCDQRLLNTPFPLSKVAISINNEKWKAEGAKLTYERYFKDCKVLVCCNSFIIDKFKNIHPNVMRASQSINPAVFKVSRETTASMRVGKNFVVGWSGNYSNKIKNFELVRESCAKSGVKLVRTKNLNREELNKWYNNNVDAVVCASNSEGGPLMILEAGACCIPVITTLVGLARELIVHEKNGLIVDWEKSSISEAILRYKKDRDERIRFAKKLHRAVTNRWTYESRLYEIKNILDCLVN